MAIWSLAHTRSEFKDEMKERRNEFVGYLVDAQAISLSQEKWVALGYIRKSLS